MKNVNRQRAAIRSGRGVAIGAVAASLLLAIAGCSASSSAGPTGSVADSLKGKVAGTVSYESWSPTADEMKAVVTGLGKEQPKIKVTTQLLPYANYLTSLKSELASGSGPDVFLLPPGAYLNQFKGFIQPIGDYADASLGSGWQSDYRPQAVNGVKVNGVAMGLPSGPFGIAGILWVNKSILDKYNLPVPTTYDQLKSDSLALEAHGISPIAFGAKDSYQLIDFYLALANDIDPKATAAAYNGTGKWTQASLVKAFGEFKQMFDDKVVQTGALGATTYNDTYNLFLDQQAAFFANGSWNMDMFVNSADKIAKMDAMVIPFPAQDASDGYKVVGDAGGALVINKNAKNKAAAYKLVEYMSKGGGAQILTNSFLDPGTLAKPLTPQVTLTANATSVKTEINDLVAHNLAGGRNITSAATQDALSQAIQSLLAGSTDAAGAAKQVQAAADGN